MFYASFLKSDREKRNTEKKTRRRRDSQELLLLLISLVCLGNTLPNCLGMREDITILEERSRRKKKETNKESYAVKDCGT